MEIRVVGLSDLGLVRSQNQDAIFLPPKGEEGRIFVLADGMGGASGGEVASALAVEGIPAAFLAARADKGVEDSLRQAFSQAAAAIHQRALAQPQLKGMGTTGVALALEGERAFMANVGDSRGYLWRQGELMQVTKDHSLVQRMVAEGSLTPEEAKHHHMRNVLTRVLGNAPQAEVDVFDLALAPGDRLLLCSDGLHGPVRDEEIGRVLATEAPLEEQARVLVELANRRGGPDNISVILVGIEKLVEDRGEATTRRTRVMAVPQSDPQSAPRPQRRSGLLALVLALALVAAAALLWVRLGGPPAAPSPGQVQLEPVAPTSDSRPSAQAASAGEGAEAPAPGQEPKP